MGTTRFRVTPTTLETRRFEYEGIVCHLCYHATSAFHKRKQELLLEAGIDTAKPIEAADEELLQVMGRAMAGTLVASIEPFEIVPDDGEKIEFRFDAPSDEDGFETQGEELLALDEGLREAVLNYCIGRDNFRVEREIRALGNSGLRSPSTEPSADAA